MKLSLDELRVESYAVQISETELAGVKGGTGPPCIGVYAVGVALVSAAAYIVTACIEAANDHQECDTRQTFEYDECGNIISQTNEHICHE